MSARSDAAAPGERPRQEGLKRAAGRRTRPDQAARGPGAGGHQTHEGNADPEGRRPSGPRTTTHHGHARARGTGGRADERGHKRRGDHDRGPEAGANATDRSGRDHHTPRRRRAGGRTATRPADQAAGGHQGGSKPRRTGEPPASREDRRGARRGPEGRTTGGRGGRANKTTAQKHQPPHTTLNNTPKPAYYAFKCVNTTICGKAASTAQRLPHLRAKVATRGRTVVVRSRLRTTVPLKQRGQRIRVCARAGRLCVKQRTNRRGIVRVRLTRIGRSMTLQISHLGPTRITAAPISVTA